MINPDNLMNLLTWVKHKETLTQALDLEMHRKKMTELS